MENISMKAIGEQFVTLMAAEDAQEGAVCKMSGSGEIDACAAGDGFVGLCGKVRDGVCGVQIGGYAEIGYTGTAPALGYTALTADGSGGVKAAGSGDKGRELLVVKVDTADQIVGLFL